ncbi:hypothetical protein BBP40_010979 [Aspergillus hancockii]|nr:hypothetical protein BBP40_010979 [Aspergillus hancockii]
MSTLVTLPTELVLAIASQLRNIEDLLSVISTCRQLYSVLSQGTPPRIILRLLAASAPTFASPHPHFLIAALARQISTWTLSQPSSRVPLLRDACRGGIDSLYEFCLQHAPDGLTLEDIRRLHSARFSIINPLSDAVDSMAGRKWVTTEDFWDGGVSEPATLMAEADRAAMQIIIYGELFGSTFDPFLEKGSGVPAGEVFTVEDRLEFVKYCIPDTWCRSWSTFIVEPVGPYSPEGPDGDLNEDQLVLQHLLTCRRWRRMWREAMAKIGDDFFVHGQQNEPRAHHWSDYYIWVDEEGRHDMPGLLRESWREKLYRDALAYQGIEGMQLVTLPKEKIDGRVLEKARWISSKIAELEKPFDTVTFGPRSKMEIAVVPDLSQEVWVGIRSRWQSNE